MQCKSADEHQITQMYLAGLPAVVIFLGGLGFQVWCISDHFLLQELATKIHFDGGVKSVAGALQQHWTSFTTVMHAFGFLRVVRSSQAIRAFGYEIVEDVTLEKNSGYIPG